MVYILRTEEQDIVRSDFNEIKTIACELGYTTFRDSLGNKYFI